ncbi:MAG: endonuclease V [Candidatus Aenigmatarchaeota archaeon]|nr:MAG: endonuclease V [Candidatus Aenigmarchaeota archaeon]
MDLEKFQEEMGKKVILEDDFEKVEVVGGVDQAFIGDDVISALVLMNRDFEILERVYTVTRILFPYRPGFLMFREGPPILRTLRRVKMKPDILMVDGHGILHPRRCGLATFVGLKSGIPTIGVGKSLLVGEAGSGEPSPVYLGSELCGYKLGKVFVSPGHKISVETSLKVAKDFMVRGIPEPIREAHIHANRIKAQITDRL